MNIYRYQQFLSSHSSTLVFFACRMLSSDNDHKKQEDGLKGSLDRVLFAPEFEFPKNLVLRLPQNTSNVKTECTGK